MFANDVLQSVSKESEYYLDPIAPSVGGLGLNPNSDSLSVPCKDDPYQLPVPCATCVFPNRKASRMRWLLTIFGGVSLMRSWIFFVVGELEYELCFAFMGID